MDSSRVLAGDESGEVVGDVQFAAAEAGAEDEHAVVEQGAVAFLDGVHAFGEMAELFDVEAFQGFEILANPILVLVVGHAVVADGVVEEAVNFQR